MAIELKDYQVTIVGGDAIKTVAQTGSGPTERHYFQARLSPKKAAGQLGGLSNPYPLNIWDHMHSELFQGITEVLADEANYLEIKQADQSVNKVIKSATIKAIIIREKVPQYYRFRYNKTTKKWEQLFNAQKEPIISNEIRYLVDEESSLTEDGFELARQNEIDNINKNMKWVV
jgi:hypothetical protein